MQRWLSRLQIKQKIIFGYALSISIAIIGTVTGLQIGDYYQRQAYALELDALEEIHLISQMHVAILEAQKHHYMLFHFLGTSRQSSEYNQLQEKSKLVESLWQKFKASAGGTKGQEEQELPGEVEERRQFIQTYRDTPERYLQQLHALLDRIDLKNSQPEKISQQRAILFEFGQSPILREIEDFTNSLDDQFKSVDEEYAQAQRHYQAANNFRWQIVSGSILLSAAIAILCALRISQTIAQPVELLTKTVRRSIEESNFNLQVPIHSNDEIGSLSRSFNQLIISVQQLLEQQQLANAKLKFYNQNLEQRGAERTRELSEAMTQLQAAQAEMIQSEKMAALGQLVAGIAHEINTPLGAIQASIGNINSALAQSLKELPSLLKSLPNDRLGEFLLLLEWARQPKEMLSSREERQLKRRLKQTLTEAKIANVEVLADSLSKMAIATELTPVLPLLQAPNAAFVLETAYQLSAIQINGQNIQMAVERAARIVYALKNYVRQDSTGELVIALIPPGIDTVLTLYHNQIKRGIELTKTYNAVPPILCYQDELLQVWSNLIGNAIQAMEERGKLAIAVWEQDRHIVVEIADSGCGIPASIQDKIFEPFFTTKPVGEGSGLGLGIVRKIVDKHHGKIELSSRSGHTVFQIWLPLGLAQLKEGESAANTFRLRLDPP